MDAEEKRLNCALDLMRRLPPQQVERHLADLIDIAPDLTENLLCSIDQPLKVARDQSCGKDYLLCDYNRDADSYRSPWSNTYDPPLEDGSTPSESLRSLEVQLNSAMQQYQDLYFGQAISSVYLWDMDAGFAGVVLIKKVGSSGQTQGQWDSIHVVEVGDSGGAGKTKYKLTATVMLRVSTDDPAAGEFDIGGSVTRQAERLAPAPNSSAHVANIGGLIEETESAMRTQLVEVYFDSQHGIVEAMRPTVTKETMEKQKMLNEQLRQTLSGRVVRS